MLYFNYMNFYVNWSRNVQKTWPIKDQSGNINTTIGI